MPSLHTMHTYTHPSPRGSSSTLFNAYFEKCLIQNTHGWLVPGSQAVPLTRWGRGQRGLRTRSRAGLCDSGHCAGSDEGQHLLQHPPALRCAAARPGKWCACHQSQPIRAQLLCVQHARPVPPATHLPNSAYQRIHVVWYERDTAFSSMQQSKLPLQSVTQSSEGCTLVQHFVYHSFR